MSKYQEITEDLLRRMRGGEWQVGDLFDSIIVLQERYGAALNTVRAGLAPLREAGYLRIEQGRHPVVIALPGPATVNAAGVLTQLLAAREALNGAIEALRQEGAA